MCPILAHATNYYLSSSTGNNSNLGTTPAQAWQTIAKLNTQPLLAGDSVLFKAGDTFTEPLNMNYRGNATNHIVFSTYGGTARVIISGFFNLTNGTSLGNNIYQFYCPAATKTTNMLVMDGVMQPMGRWPDTGYRTYTAITNNTITDGSLPASPNWTGAYLVAHDEFYVIDTALITSQNTLTGVITVNQNFTYHDITRGNGYFIENDPRTLLMTTTPGRWYNNYTKDSIQVYLPGGQGTHTLQVPIQDYLFRIDNKGYIDVYNMDFEGSNLYTVLGNFDTAFTMTNCLYRYGAGNCFLLNESLRTSLVNDTLDFFQNNGALVTGLSSNYALVKNTQSNHIGLIPGMGQRRGGNGTQSYSGWSWPNGKSTFQNMTMLNTGYIGLYYAGDSVTIKNCVVDTFCVTKSDGGAFYTTDSVFFGYNSGRSMTNCMALHGYPTVGVPSNPSDASFGFYFDAHSQSVVLTNCTGAYNASAGLFIHGAKITSTGSNYYGNGWAQLFISQPSTDSVFQLTLKKNRLATSAPGQYLSAIFMATDPITGINSVIDSNYYAKTDTSAFFIQPPGTGPKTVAFPTWQQQTGFDAHSTFRNVCTTFVYNTRSTTAAKTVFMNDLAGNPNNSSVNVAAFSSLILYFVSP